MSGNETVLKILIYIGKKKTVVGTVEISQELNIPLRNVQRNLVTLTKLGIIKADNSNPKGYKFEGF